jgi:hypothetical protein
LPLEFKELKAAEIEHLACSKKDELKQMKNKQ